MGPETWTVTDEWGRIASRTQVPLKLAWALTVHKCQGMTVDRVRTYLSQAFGCGMVYVALSRVRSLEGLFIEGFDRNLVRVSAGTECRAAGEGCPVGVHWGVGETGEPRFITASAESWR